MALIEGFSHIVLPVSDLDRSEAFYVDVFGLEKLGRDLVAEAGPNSVLKSDCRQMVVLVQVPADQVRIEREGANSTHHAWLMRTPEQYKALEKHLASLGFDVNDYRAAFRAKGQYSVDLVDPDGHRWQIQAQGPEATEIRMERVGVVSCGPAAGYGVGNVKLFKDEKFFLLRVEDGFLALSQWCTHMNGMVKWRDYFFDFYCPKHGATFNREGVATSSIMQIPPLRLHPVSISDAGDVLVDTDRVVVRRDYDPAQVVRGECGAALCVEKLKYAKEVV
ncbi:MAG: VOC family protein [Alphaproteobacteria bacterium]